MDTTTPAVAAPSAQPVLISLTPESCIKLREILDMRIKDLIDNGYCNNGHQGLSLMVDVEKDTLITYSESIYSGISLETFGIRPLDEARAEYHRAEKPDWGQTFEKPLMERLEDVVASTIQPE